MNADFTPLVAAFAALMTMWWQPFNVVLVIAIWILVHFLWRAAHAPGFDIFEALRDEAGKPSFDRIAYLVALVLSSWAFMSSASSWATNPREFVEIFVAYVLLWALPKMVSRWIDAKYGRREGEGK
jgi:hypothetical protein